MLDVCELFVFVVKCVVSYCYVFDLLICFVF